MHVETDGWKLNNIIRIMSGALSLIRDESCCETDRYSPRFLELTLKKIPLYIYMCIYLVRGSKIFYNITIFVVDHVDVLCFSVLTSD